VIIVVVQVGAVKIYVGAVGKKERGGQSRMKLSLPQKTGAFLSFTPLLNANVFFCKLFLGPNSGFRCCVFLMTLWKTLLQSEIFTTKLM